MIDPFRCRTGLTPPIRVLRVRDMKQDSDQMNPCRKIVAQQEPVMIAIWQPTEYLLTSWIV